MKTNIRLSAAAGHQVVHEIDHMSDLHVDSSFYRKLMKIDNYLKIVEWMDSSVGQSTVIQINKTNDLILNLTPENVTQHSRIE